MSLINISLFRPVPTGKIVVCVCASAAAERTNSCENKKKPVSSLRAKSMIQKHELCSSTCHCCPTHPHTKFYILCKHISKQNSLCCLGFAEVNDNNLVLTIHPGRKISLVLIRNSSSVSWSFDNRLATAYIVRPLSACGALLPGQRSIGWDNRYVLVPN